MAGIYKAGFVAGRFQPPHNGHREYILEAKRRCRFLWVGITQFDVCDRIPCETQPHRSSPASNPLTYFERVRIMTEMLIEAGLPRHEFACTPFPIDEPDKMADFISTDVPCFTTVFDEWNRQKIQVLEGAGYTVIVLYERGQKDVSGFVVRSLIIQGNDKWMELVPNATIRGIEHYGVRERLIELGRSP